MRDEISGTTIAGRYRIVETLGQGGLGTVYKALDMRASRLIALKVLRSEFVSNTELENLIKEFRVLASLSHPNIVKAYDCAKAGDLVYIALEYVQGRSLAQILAEGKPLELDAAVGIVRQVATALDFAHRNKFIHRDVKPANILISEDGRVLLSDFGLARPLGESGLTEIGTIRGTPAYMSPEQATGQLLDARSDVFSLGVVLYQSLTGRSPFTGESTGGILKNVVESDPPEPSAFNSLIDPRLQDIVLKAIAKDPEHRFASMHLFVETLSSFEASWGAQQVLNLANIPNDSGDEANSTQIAFLDDEDSPDSSNVVMNLKDVIRGAKGDDGLRMMQASFLVEAGKELAGASSLPDLYRTAVDLLVSTLRAERAVLMTLENDGQLIVRAAVGDSFRISAAVSDRVLKTDESILVHDSQDDPGFRVRRSIVEQPVRSLMAVPLRTKDRTIGLIYVDSRSLNREFTKDDLNLLNLLAGALAVRIEDAKMAEVEAAITTEARVLQQEPKIQEPANAPTLPASAAVPLSSQPTGAHQVSRMLSRPVRMQSRLWIVALVGTVLVGTYLALKAPRGAGANAAPAFLVPFIVFGLGVVLLLAYRFGMARSRRDSRVVSDGPLENVVRDGRTARQTHQGRPDAPNASSVTSVDLLDRIVGEGRLGGSIINPVDRTGLVNELLAASPTTETTPHITLPLSSTQIQLAEPSALAWLLFLNGELRGRQFRLTDMLTIGRSSDSDLILITDTSISRQHARIALENGRFYIYDLESKRGTRVNGESVQKKELRDRDEIRIGAHAMLFISAVSPADLTFEAKRRLQDLDALWEGLVRSVRHD